MHPPRHSAGGLLKVLLSALVLVGILVVPTVHAQAPPCPSVVVSAYAKPRSVRKPGSAFAVFARVSTTSVSTLQNVSLRITVPFSAKYPHTAKRFGQGDKHPVIAGPSAYWLGSSLTPGKPRVFKLTGRVNKCSQAGVFDVDVAAYVEGRSCSTPLSALVKVRGYKGLVNAVASLHKVQTSMPPCTPCIYITKIAIAAPRSSKRPLPACPGSTGPYIVYPMQVPFGAQPAPTRRLKAADAKHRTLTGTIEDCIARCAETGLSTPYYAAMSGDACYCSPGRYVCEARVYCMCVLVMPPSLQEAQEVLDVPFKPSQQLLVDLRRRVHNL